MKEVQQTPHLFEFRSYLSVAAIAATPWSAITSWSTTSAATAATVSATTTARTASWPVTVRTICATMTGVNGFTIRIFTIEVRLAFIVREVAATFKGNGFFAF